MKRTDMEKRERELKRAKKKEEKVDRSDGGEKRNVGDFINDLHKIFYYDEQRIYNVKDSVEVLELFEQMKADLDETQWENVLRKAIKKSAVKDRDQALKELTDILNEA